MVFEEIKDILYCFFFCLRIALSKSVCVPIEREKPFEHEGMSFKMYECSDCHETVSNIRYCHGENPEWKLGKYNYCNNCGRKVLWGASERFNEIAEKHGEYGIFNKETYMQGDAK